MSLFPAYSVEAGSSSSQKSTEKNKDSEDSWLENSSFIPFITENVEEIQKISSSETEETPSLRNRDEYKSSKKRKKEKKKNKDRKRSPSPVQMEFTGDEEYYVDKKPIRGYLAVETLHKPACPKYRTNCRIIGYHQRNRNKKNIRYYTKLRSDKNIEENNQNFEILNEEEYSRKTKEFNRKLSKNPTNIDVWIEYVHHQNKAPIKMTKTQLAERKTSIIEKSLIHNLGNEQLYKLYVEIVDSTYPSFEVTKMLEKLLAKDQTNYILWNAKIFATQGSMARCIVPDVLKLYEECMQKMYRKSQEDEIMLKLFKNCALFLRQSGLSEQFFALIKLALELNISVDKFTNIQPNEKDQQTLIEYEEIILKSGLPMNEIWLRIEKLRQNYNFLPCPTNSNCSDPQRIVFNEDICYFIFPLTNKENSFKLIMIILKLLKIPFIDTTSLQNHFLFKIENLNEFDTIEDLLRIFLYQTTTSRLFTNSLKFDLIIYELCKEMISGPSYLNINIGYEIFLNTILEILLLCSECYKTDERKRSIFILLWLKFKRILLILEKSTTKISKDFQKTLKTQIKNLLKIDENRNILNFYIEYGLIEYELGNFNNMENIFIKSITESSTNISKADLCYAYITFAEIYLNENDHIKALKILTCYTLQISLTELNNPDSSIISESKKLISLKKLTEQLNDIIFIEKNVNIIELEQYFLPDYFINLIKAKIYYQLLLNLKLEAIEYLENLLRKFIDKQSQRHQFIRESIYEILIKLLLLSNKKCFISNLLIYETLQRALNEFPENLYLLKVCATLDGQPWYKLRKILINTNSPIGILFLIGSARYRFLKYNSEKFLDNTWLSSNIDGNEKTYKIRIENILKSVTNKNSGLRKNSIMWRLYLKCLADLQADFDKCKNVLFSALDECPWHKALYIDGSIVVPQELSQIQDLIIEKQLRIYALPEELEILRNDTFESVTKSENNNSNNV